MSTDGGVTFSSTPVLTVGVSAVVTTRTVTLTSTSATTVIRFRATSDFGLTDIGLDNVRIVSVLATRNEALAATVGLYPNPAHHAFTLALPAGPLGSATATLRNALGQVVLTKNLSNAATEQTLATGRLAAGIYTLRVAVAGQVLTRKVVLE